MILAATPQTKQSLKKSFGQSLMQKFQLVLKNDKVKSYQLLFLLFIFLDLGFLLAYAFRDGSRTTWIVSISSALLALASLRYSRGSAQNSRRLLAPVLLAFAFAFFHIWWAVAALAVFTGLYFVSVRSLIVVITGADIIYPSFPKKHIAWNDLNNVVLKDGILTLDFRNNRIAQSELAITGKDYAVREKEFNEFCQMQLQQEKSA